jgi:hypothetical protein
MNRLARFHVSLRLKEKEWRVRRNLTRPQNPQLLGHVFAALRVHSGQREPKNDTERRINEELNSYGASLEAARRMVATLDAMPASARLTLLGEIAAPDFVPPETAAPAEVDVTFTRDMTDRIAANMTETTGGVAANTTAARLGGRENVLEGREEVMGEGPRPQLVYTVRYNGLWCQEESNWDRFSGSDEIYLITSAVHIAADGSNVVRTERHPVAQSEDWYEDVDSGEERTGPVAACWFENSDPVSLTVVVIEHDEGDPDAWKDEIDALVKAVIAVVSYFYPALAWVALLSGPITDSINWVVGTGDDPVETKTVVLPRALLEQYAGQWPYPHIGSRTDSGGLFGFATVVPVATNFMQHFITTHNGGGATYVAGFEILRDPPIDRPVILL